MHRLTPHQTAGEGKFAVGRLAWGFLGLFLLMCPTTAPVIPAGAGSSNNGDMMKISTMAIAAVFLVTSQVGAQPVKLDDGALGLVTAAGKPVNGNGAPYVQTPVKAPNVVKGKGAVVVNPKGGAIVKGKK